MEGSGAVEVIPLKTYAIGDIHGAYRALMQCFERSKFDYNLPKDAWEAANYRREAQITKYDDIFIGHTTTEIYRTLQPIHVCNVWDLDTGAGWSGKLTIMDVDSKEYWQPDLSKDLYGGLPNQL